MSRFFFIIVVFGVSFSAEASKLGKGFNALKVHNYFLAKKLFESTEIKHTAASCFGLSVIYQNTKNPFTNIDSAYSKITKSFSEFTHLSLKYRSKYLAYGVDSFAIIRQRNIISNDLFNRSLFHGTLQSYNQFINNNPWSIHVSEAIYNRDSLAFYEITRLKTADNYKKFMEAYPESSFYNEAKIAYEKQVYIEETKDNSLSSYMGFLKKHPDNPYKKDAEDFIYKLSTQTGTVDSYRLFIASYPVNRNINNAWRKLFNAYISDDYSTKRIALFEKHYPAYPFLSELSSEKSSVNSVLLPTKNGDFWGFIGINSSNKIEAKFEAVEPFSEGLAVAKLNDKFGFLNKKGVWQIEPLYDDAISFKKGFALVEIDELWGMINRSGEFVIPADYLDLGEYNEGLVYFQKDSLYGYFDEQGIIRLKPIYDEAYDFEKGKALVVYKDYFGLIDEFGTTTIPFVFNDLMKINDSLWRADNEDYYGVVTDENDTVIPFNYDYIGKTTESLFIIEKEDVFNYLKWNGDTLLTEWLNTYPEYKQLSQFINGHAKIPDGDGFNLIDLNGKKIFSSNKEGLGNYSTIMAFKKGENWGYVNTFGEKVINTNYTVAQSFGKSFAIAGKSPLIGLINKKGEYVVEPYFEKLTVFNDTLVLAQSIGLEGLLNVKGDTLLPFNFISIEPIDTNIVEVERDDKLYYYNLKEKRFIILE